MTETSAPAMSVVIVTRDDFESIRWTVRHLRAQTARHLLEIVFVCPSEDNFHLPPPEARDFWGFQIVSVGEVRTVGTANAAGIRRARAPIVALAEDHCFPEPQWAEALIAAHHGPWAAVGPAVKNANPATMVSWSDFVIGYSPWMHPARAGPASFLPGHNSSYKKAALLEYGNRLEDMMDAETVLHMDLVRNGRELYLEPRAVAAHTNFSAPSIWLPVQFHAGRAFAGARARGWPLARRLVYFAASPLIPCVRLSRCLRQLKRGGHFGLLFRILPVLSLGLVLDGAGQMMGYIAGAGHAPARLGIFEFNRFRYITESDRRRLAAAQEATR